MTVFEKIQKNIIAISKWIFLGVLVGVVGGAVGSLFHISIDYVTTLRGNHPFLICLLPLGGILTAFMYSRAKAYGNIDIKRVFLSVKKNKDIPFVMIPLIFAGTLITHMFGGSAGKEGAALQLGGSMGYNLAKKLKKDDKSTALMVTAGMSSVFSALFGTPFAAAFFSLEVTKEGRLNYKGLLPGVFSSLTGYGLSRLLGIAPVRLDMPKISEYHILLILKILLLALMCGGVCIIFATAIRKTESMMKKYIANCYIRAFVGGALIILLTVVLKTTDYNGAGMDVIKNAVLGETKNIAFIMKIVFTAITVAAGFKGGEIVPTFFIGATFGCFMGGFLGVDAGVSAAFGLVAMFAGMTKCPATSLLLAAEVFGVREIPLFAAAIIITTIVSGRFGLYENADGFGKNLLKRIKGKAL